MAKRNISFNLDFSMKDILPKFSIKQFDNALISITTLLGGEVFNPINNTCKLYVSVGNDVFLQETNIKVLENLIEIDLDKNTISSAGKALAELELTDSNGIFTSATFIFEVDSKVGEGSTLPKGVEGFIAKHERLINEFKAEYNPKLDTINKSISDIKIKDSEQDNKLCSIESKNIEQDNKLKEVARVNKTQQVYINGLFNENKDGRLSVEGEGNDLKLEGSKQGLVEVDKIVGNTMVNIMPKVALSSSILKDNWITLNVTGAYDHLLPKGIFGDLLKVDTTYTIIIIIKNNTLSDSIRFITGSNVPFTSSSNNLINPNVNGTLVFTVRTHSDLSSYLYDFWLSHSNTITGSIDIQISILEGDYTNKPIPNQYIEGLKSSFEENLVTQEMVNEGLESEENLGKYKVPVKVVGKNLFDVNSIRPYIIDEDTETFTVNHYQLYKNFSIDLSDFDIVTISYECSNTPGTNARFIFVYSDGTIENVTSIFSDSMTKYTKTSNKNKKISSLKVAYGSIKGNWVIKKNTIQLEEGTVATDYEDYFERTTNVYLNSPLLEGDEIVMKDGELCHYHKMGSIIFDGSVDEGWSPDNSVNTSSDFYCMYTTIIPKIQGSNGKVICDNLPFNYEKNFNIETTTRSGGGYFEFILKATNTTEFTTRLSELSPTVVYQLAEPYYEPISTDKLLLECANDSTLHIDTVVPVEIKASYTGNVPSVYAIEETGITNTEDISVTQNAVDFLLMSSMGEVMMMSFNENTRGGNQMGAYFASRIMKGALKYEDVIRKYPEFKDDIDFILRSEGYEHLIVEIQ